MTSFSITGSLENLSPIRQWLQGELTALAVSDEASSDMMLAASEICTNIVRHGYGEVEEKGNIDLQLDLSGQEIQLTIIDSARPFLPREIKSPVPEDLATGGYGLFLVQTLMDDVLYQPLAPSGNRVVLTKLDKGSQTGT